jgi:hypothetical protein
MHRIEIMPIALTERCQLYQVTCAGSILIEKTRVPAFDACRALLARGITGKLGAWRPGKECPDTQLDIEIGGLSLLSA